MALFANSSAWRGSYWSGPVPAPMARNTHFLFVLPNWAGFTLWEVLSQTHRQQTDVNTHQSVTAQQQKHKATRCNLVFYALYYINQSTPQSYQFTRACARAKLHYFYRFNNSVVDDTSSPWGQVWSNFESIWSNNNALSCDCLLGCSGEKRQLPKIKCMNLLLCY